MKNLIKNKFSKAVLSAASLALTMSFASCSNEEGKGGNAAIQGYVYNIIDNGDIISDGMGGYKFDTDTIRAIGKDVYIVYGGNGAYDDKNGTNAFGFYKFDYLREGNYMIYAVGDSSDQKSVVMKNVKIGAKGDYNVEPIILHNGKNSKMSGIVGSVLAMYPNEDDYSKGVGVRVYIKNVNGGEQNDTRADNDGIYRFSRLQPNTQYIVWAETEVRKNYKVTSVEMKVTTNAEGNVTNITNLPLKVTIF